MATIGNAPTIAVSVDGKSIVGAAWERLIRLEVTDREGIRSDGVTIEFDDSFPRFVSPRRGAVLTVTIGYAGEEFSGDYVVDQVEYACLPHKITVSGHAADLREELKTAKSRHWDDTSVGTIVRQIAGEHGLLASVAEAVGAHVYDWIGQLEESDLAFLERLARRHGAR